MKTRLVIILFLLAGWCAFAQTGSRISGVILDVEGEPLPGAAVSVPARQLGVLADADGSYDLDGVRVGDIIRFEMLGFLPQEVEYKGEKTHNIVLRLSSEVFDDVIVVGYGTQKKVSVTGSLSQIQPEVLISKPAPTLSTILGGSMPGIMTRQSSGDDFR